MIGKGTVVDGDVRVPNSVRIDGKVNGNVKTSDTVVLGKEGEVVGKIQAKHVMLAGKVRGNIAATGKVFLESTASIFGDIKASRLVVDEGALFEGKCRMNEGEVQREKTEIGGGE